MLDYYFSPGPNPLKVSLFLMETGIEFNPIAVDVLKGDHLTDAFVKLNPNSKVPAIIDDGKPVFDSQAILLYLAEKHRQFLAAPADRGALLSWLMFVASGLGPFSGQAVHFKNFAPEPKDYALNRYVFEARRHFRVLDDHLEGRDWIVGDQYSIVDMAAWGWINFIEMLFGDEAKTEFPNVARLLATINDRPAAHKARSLIEDHDFNMEFDEAALDKLFRHRLA